MPSQTLPPASSDRAPPHPEEPSKEPESGRPVPQRLCRSALVPNEGSTARDYCARERNFLSWIKLSSTLAVISASLLIRFQFGTRIGMPDWEVAAETPLGILFFIATLAAIIVSATTFHSTDTGYAQRKAFVYAGQAAELVSLAIGLLTIAACVLLLAADT
ncbi:hypothetical protein JCM10207_008043 [Rhodosporidiobolus poonsookiae]